MKALELKQQFRSYMESFELHMRNKQSFMFASESQRENPARTSLSPGPGAYIGGDSQIGRKKDFSRPVRIYVGPTRNLDGAVMSSKHNPSLQA